MDNRFPFVRTAEIGAFQNIFTLVSHLSLLRIGYLHYIKTRHKLSTFIGHFDCHSSITFTAHHFSCKANSLDAAVPLERWKVNTKTYVKPADHNEYLVYISQQQLKVSVRQEIGYCPEK